MNIPIMAFASIGCDPSLHNGRITNRKKKPNLLWNGDGKPQISWWDGWAAFWKKRRRL